MNFNNIEKAESILANMVCTIVYNTTKYPNDVKKIIQYVYERFHLRFNNNEVTALNNIVYMIDNNTGILTSDDISKIDIIHKNITTDSFTADIDEIFRIIYLTPIYEQFKTFFLETLFSHIRGCCETLLVLIIKSMISIINSDKLFETSDEKLSDLSVLLSSLLEHPCQLYTF